MIDTGFKLVEDVLQETSNKIKSQILDGCSTEKPGWVRISMHPTIKDSELEFISNSLVELCKNIHEWSKDYVYDSSKNDYVHKSVSSVICTASLQPFFRNLISVFKTLMRP